MYRFIESVKWKNGRAELLDYHQRRVNETFQKFFPETTPFLLSEWMENENLPTHDITYKLRLVYDHKIVQWEILPYRQNIPKGWFFKEIEDYTYGYKFENREILDGISREFARGSDFIMTQNGFITDSYYANLIFWDGENWSTPKNCLLRGTRRRYLLDKGEIREANIHKNDLSQFIYFKRINAMIGLEDSPSFEIRNINF